MKKIIIYQFVILIMAMMFFYTDMEGQELSFSIKLDKAAYKRGAPINCTMTITNTGNTDIVLNNRFLVNYPDGPHEVSLQLIGPDLKQVPIASLIRAGFQSKRFMVLKPGSSEADVYRITDNYKLDKPGKYSVVAYYENKNDTPKELNIGASWKGTLLSNKESFSIR
jgi:hypothetical protein